LQSGEGQQFTLCCAIPYEPLLLTTAAALGSSWKVSLAVYAAFSRPIP